MIQYIKTHKELRFIAYWAAIGIFYFCSEHLFSLRYHTVSIPLDDKIPFIPAFIIPYILWFPYILAGLFAVYFTDRTAMAKQGWILLPGMLLCTAVFILFPTQFLRPEVTGKDFFSWICRLVYANDHPNGNPASPNAFPSLHCYEAVAIHLSVFVAGPLKGKTGWRIGSAILVVLICLSTVFVKQHSAIDGVAGCLLAILAFCLTNAFYKEEEK